MTEPHDIKEKALTGVKWNTIGQFGRQALSFVVSIALARLLEPEDFGLVAMLYIFSELANAFVNSGLTAPLIQNKHISDEDCSTVFWFNIAVGVVFYALLVACAPPIARFYAEPQLSVLIKYFALTFLIHAFENVQLALVLRELNYKKQNLVLLFGTLLSGLLAVLMARRGFGAYSLVGQSVSFATVTTVLYWRTSAWRPSFCFSRAAFKNHFRFGSKILLVSLLDKTMNAIDNLIVGKIYGTMLLGHYARGKGTRDLVAANVTNMITALVFPVFSRIETTAALRAALSRVLGVVAYLAAPVMVGIGLVAEPLILVLYSSKWLPAVVYLQLFCLFGVTVPLSAVMVHTILSRGDSSAFLRLELIKKAILLLAMGVGVAWGLKGFLVALCLGSYLALFVTTAFLAKLLETSSLAIVRDVLPGAILSLLMGVPVYLMTHVHWSSRITQLGVQSVVGVVTYVGLSILFRSGDYLFLREVLSERLLGLRGPSRVSRS